MIGLGSSVGADVRPIREHRADLDGLRGIAVLGVFLYHLDPAWLPGGFLGVDVFFVLSGYLITGIILPQILEKRFSFGVFFQRRIARIFPALAAMLLSVLVFAAWFYPKEDVSSIGAAGAAAALGVANLKFMMQGSYFQILPDTQPLLHTWSLGVEEQYYLCVPILLVLLHRINSSLSVMRAVLWMLAIVSYFLCVWMTVERPNMAFYFMPLRAWELLFGAILAVSEYEGRGLRECRGRKDLYSLSVLGIIGCMVLVTERMAFPGWVAMLPVACTVQAIASGRSSGPSWVHSWISSGVMTGIGRLSYSLYLWHWPVFCFVDYTFLEWSGLGRLTSKILLSAVISVVSYRLLESPLRLFLGRRESMRLAYGVLVVGTISLMCKGVWDWRTGYLNASVASISRGGVEVRGREDGPRVVLYGDSVGSSQATSIAELVVREGGVLHVMSSAGSRPVPPSGSFNGLMTFLSDQRVDCIIIACAWHNYLESSERVQEMVLGIQGVSDAKIVLVGPAPFLPEPARREQIRERGYERYRESVGDRQLRERVEAMLVGFENSRVELLRCSDLLLESDHAIRFRTPEGWQVYQDYLHLSSYGSRLVWGSKRRWLR